MHRRKAYTSVLTSHIIIDVVPRKENSRSTNMTMKEEAGRPSPLKWPPGTDVKDCGSSIVMRSEKHLEGVWKIAPLRVHQQETTCHTILFHSPFSLCFEKKT